jgi:hypothetical protein
MSVACSGGVVVHSPAVAKLTLLVDPGSLDTLADRVSEFLEIVKVVASEEDVLLIPLTKLLWWVSTQDVQEVGYPSWPAFRTEHSPWERSRTNDYLRLVGSELDVIKEAVSKGEITFASATQSTRTLGRSASPEAQARWLREFQMGIPSTRHPAFSKVFTDGEMRRILRARRGAEVVIGGQPPTPVVDRFLLDCHEQKLTREQVFQSAHETPSVPERLGRVMPAWKDDPSASLFGPWVTPTGVHEAVSRLRQLLALYEHRRVLRAMAYSLLRDHALWRWVPGCRSLAELCRVHLGLDQRTFQRCAADGPALIANPDLRKEIEQGVITLDRATFAIHHASSEHPLQIWVALTRRLGRAELQHADARGAEFVAEYSPALELAQEVEAALASDETTRIGSVTKQIAHHLREVGATGPVQVAVRDDRNRPLRTREPMYILAPPELLAAADYFLAEMALPPVHGFRRIVEHDRYTCQNPRCRNRTIRVHPHHMHQRQHGGTDAPRNMVTGCPACHLRGIHTGRMSVVRIDDWLVWSWRSGGVVLMASPIADLVDASEGGRTNSDRAAVPASPGQPSEML